MELIDLFFFQKEDLEIFVCRSELGAFFWDSGRFFFPRWTDLSNIWEVSPDLIRFNPDKTRKPSYPYKGYDSTLSFDLFKTHNATIIPRVWWNNPWMNDSFTTCRVIGNQKKPHFRSVIFFWALKGWIPLCPKVVAYIVFFFKWNFPEGSKVRKSESQLFWLVFAKKKLHGFGQKKAVLRRYWHRWRWFFCHWEFGRVFVKKRGAVRSLLFIGLMHAMNWINSDLVLWEWYTIDFEIDVGESMGSLLLKRWFHLKHSEIHGNLWWKSVWWYLAIDITYCFGKSPRFRSYLYRPMFSLMFSLVAANLMMFCEASTGGGVHFKTCVTDFWFQGNGLVLHSGPGWLLVMPLN